MSNGALVFVVIAVTLVISFQRGKIQDLDKQIVHLNSELATARGYEGRLHSCQSTLRDMSSNSEAIDKISEDLRKLADAQAKAANTKATQILVTPPAVPGDDCKSAKVFVDDYLKGRNK